MGHKRLHGFPSILASHPLELNVGATKDHLADVVEAVASVFSGGDALVLVTRHDRSANGVEAGESMEHGDAEAFWMPTVVVTWRSKRHVSSARRKDGIPLGLAFDGIELEVDRVLNGQGDMLESIGDLKLVWEVISHVVYVIDDISSHNSWSREKYHLLRYLLGESSWFTSAGEDATGAAGMNIGRRTLSAVVKTRRTTKSLSIALERYRSSADDSHDMPVVSGESSGYTIRWR